MDKLECEVSSFNYGPVESAITNYYGMGFPSSSNFMELKEGLNSITIIADKASGDFNVLAYTTKDGKKMINCTLKGKLKRKR